MQPRILAVFLCWAVVPTAAFGTNEQDPHGGVLTQLSPCVEACLKKDTDLHRQTLSVENVQKTMQDIQESCLVNDYDLHVQTLLIFMSYGRSKEYILEKLTSFMDQNSLATMGCLFGAFLKKLNEDSKATQNCLGQCADRDFKQIAAKEEL